VLLETHGLTIGCHSLPAGHLVATWRFTWRNRTGHWRHSDRWRGGGVAWSLPAARGGAGIAFYAFGLGAMAGAALVSRFPLASGWARCCSWLSDLLIFAQMGPLARDRPLPGLLIWPTYFAAQALIAWGVVTTLRKEAT
jgi:uncharacterized membrane protein YhhN